MKTYFVGSHDTGKTTLARRVSRAYGIPLLTETARAVTSEREVGIGSMRRDLDLVDDVQREIFCRQVDLEAASGASFVSDRAFDNVAYAAEHSTVAAEMIRSRGFQAQVARMKKSTVFFVRPHRDVGGSDGVREARDWDGMVRIDGMIKLLLEMNEISYVPIWTPSLQERWRVVVGVLGIPEAVEG